MDPWETSRQEAHMRQAITLHFEVSLRQGTKSTDAIYRQNN